MKNKGLVSLVAVFAIVISSMSFATSFEQNEVVMPTTEVSVVSSSGIIANQFNYDEKFTHTFINGCYLECPLNMKTPNGTISIKKCVVSEPKIEQGYNARFNFEHTGPNSMHENFYIRAYDINGVLIDERKFVTDFDQDYNFKKQKYTYKVLPTDETYAIPFAAVKVIVENDYGKLLY